MSDEKVRFTGDSTSLVQAADRGTKAIQRQEQAVRGAAKAGKTLGSELAQTFTGMAKGVLITAAVTKSLEAAAEAAERIRKAGAETAAAKGGEAVDIERALISSGANLSPEQRQSILGMVGEGTTAAGDTAGFIQAFAKKKGRRLTAADMTRATQAFTSGAYSQEELLDARVLPTFAQQQSRIAGMSPEARAELEARAGLRTGEAAARAAAGMNQGARFVDMERERRRLESPVAQGIMDAISSIPGIGRLLGEGEADIIQKQKNRELRLASDQLDRIAPTPRPITGTQGNRE